MRLDTHLIDTLPRLRLATLPTPLEDAPRLAKHLGISRLLIKRDDLTGLAFGGNKARKLEYELPQAVASHCDALVTVGGVQSNHARMVAAAGRKLGIEAKLVLGGPKLDYVQGNLLLDTLFGAEIRYLVDDDDNDHLAAAMHEWTRELKASGRSPYELPIGGSTGLGALGYVQAMRELVDQFGQEPVHIVVAVGSCGTLAGVRLGASLFMPNARVIGISVSRTSLQIAGETNRLVAEAATILRLPEFCEEQVESFDCYYEEYGAFTDSARDAILTSARLEGILLDPVYTGKAMAGLFDLVSKGILRKDIPTIFLHTGGLPILFAYAKQFESGAFIRYL
ncbi:MAG TPA: D-cysteine desulfhydrase family protein [Bacteroidota bacterium]|nr:D-cysteine desulfhydrase family protein [Bacteroidota bacterium]